MKVLNATLSEIINDKELITKLKGWIQENEVIIIKKAYYQT